MSVAESNTATQNRAVLSHRAALRKTAAQFEEQVRKGQVVNPVTGTVLTKYTFAGEMATMGKPLYRIANTDTLTLRAYFTGTQLPQVKLGQAVRVRIDGGGDRFKTLSRRHHLDFEQVGVYAQDHSDQGRAGQPGVRGKHPGQKRRLPQNRHVRRGAAASAGCHELTHRAHERRNAGAYHQDL